MRKFVTLLLSVAFISACTTSPQNSKPDEAEVNYAHLIDQEIKKLMDMHAGLEKTIYYQGNIEKKIIDHPDWNKELRPFLQCNIQTPAFDKLFSESRRVSGDSLILVYSAKTDKSEVRKLEIYMLNQRLDSISAELFRQNSYFMLNETLQYAPSQGYLISGSQKMMFAAETVYRIEAHFMLPS